MLDSCVAGPLYVENDRPFIDLAVGGDMACPIGRFLVDTGGGGILITEAVARQGKVSVTGKPSVEEWGLQLEQVPPVPLTFSGHELILDGEAFVILESGEPGSGNMISGRALSHYQVIFDFPSRRFGLSLGHKRPDGVPVPTPIHEQTKFPRIEVSIAGEQYGMLLDTGAGCTMISPRLLETWRRQHPDWTYVEGVHGSARKRRDLDEGAVMVRIPSLMVGPFERRGVWAVARQMGGNFEAFSEQMMTGPASGALGGNVLGAFRVVVDYAEGVSYIQKPPEAEEEMR